LPVLPGSVQRFPVQTELTANTERHVNADAGH
jgi:hypothetical protein